MITSKSKAKEAQAEVRKKFDNSQQTHTELSQSVESLTKQREALEEQLKDVSKLAQKANAIVSANEESHFQIQSLQQQVDNLVAQNEKLTSSTEQRWFMIGAGTLILGGILGLVFPLSRKKKVSSSSW